MKTRDLVIMALFYGVIFNFYFTRALPLLDFDRIDAAWFVVQTITTTGYGSIDNWSNELKLLSIELMLIGATFWTLFISACFKYLWPDQPAVPPAIE